MEGSSSGKGRGRGRGRGRGKGKEKETAVGAGAVSQPEQAQSQQMKQDQSLKTPAVQSVLIPEAKTGVLNTETKKDIEQAEKKLKDFSLSTHGSTVVSKGTKQKHEETTVIPKQSEQQQPEKPVKEDPVEVKIERAAEPTKPTSILLIGSTSFTSEIRGKEYKIPKRPGFGTVGKPVKLVANFYPIKIPDIVIHQYDVTINEDKLPKSLNQKIICDFVESNPKLFKSLPVFDGRKNLYTKDPFDFSGKKEFKFPFKEEERQREIKIVLQWTAQINLRTLDESLKSNSKALVPKEAIQSLDVVLRQTASLKFVPLGSRFFSPNGAVSIGCGLEVWHGYHMSVRPTQWKMLMNVDVSNTAFNRPILVTEYLNEITGYDCSKERQPLTDSCRKRFHKEIKGLKIEINYMGKQKRKYKVNGVTEKIATQQMFSIEENGKKRSISVADYFKQEKKVTLQYPSLHCLHVGDASKTIYLPMEVCKIVPGQRCLKRLNEAACQEMIKIASKRPNLRQDTITKIMNEANLSEDKYLKSFGVEVTSKMVELSGRILPTPGIKYGDRDQPLLPANGAWNMKGRRLYNGAVIQKWGLIVYDIGRPLQNDALLKFQAELIKSAREMGIQIGEPIYQARAPEKKIPELVITDAFKKDNGIELLVFILPGKTPFYGDIKRLCETENGFASFSDPTVQKLVKERGLCTQCVQAKNVLKCNPMTLAQLCLKINSKMGGVNNVIDNNKITRPINVFKEPVIFLGADVTHPGLGDKKSPSIAAIVGSIDVIPSRYAACVRVQGHRVEVIEDLENVTVELLKQFYRNLRVKPKKIIMFRDGVSEGQFQQVLLHEMSAIQKACMKLEKDYQPGITFVVVQKRHKAKFFPVNKFDEDRSGNVSAGTTIDTVVCHPTEFDYYQYSHAGIQGTSRPAHYHVLWDDNNLSADELQALSFMLCHLYVRCTRSVSIPAPAYYAHHVAFRSRSHLQNEDGSFSSSESDPGSISDKLTNGSLKEIVKLHPKMETKMYFV